MIVKLPTGYGPLFATGLPSEPAPFVSPTLRSIHTPSRRSCSTFTTLPTFAYNQCPHASPGVSPRHASILPAIYMDCRPSYTSTPAISAQSGPILALIPPLVCQPKLAHRKKKARPTPPAASVAVPLRRLALPQHQVLLLLPPAPCPHKPRALIHSQQLLALSR